MNLHIISILILERLGLLEPLIELGCSGPR